MSACILTLSYTATCVDEDNSVVSVMLLKIKITTPLILQSLFSLFFLVDRSYYTLKILNAVFMSGRQRPRPIVCATRKASLHGFTNFDIFAGHLR